LLEKMSKLEMVRGLSPISHAKQFYDTSMLAKHHHGAFLKQSKYHADKALELVHGDLYGPIKPRQTILLLIDDAPCYMWVALLVAKSEAAAEKECGHKLRC
jgi:hypothetical protein